MTARRKIVRLTQFNLLLRNLLNSINYLMLARLSEMVIK
jgi:hypothetical protein